MSCGSVTLAGITDGTSNTIAFGEGLVGDYGRTNNYRGNGMSGAVDGAESSPEWGTRFLAITPRPIRSP